MESVPRVRPYRKPWLLGPALAVSFTAQAGGLVLLEATRPEPLPTLTLRFAGEGQGLVLVTRVGDHTPLARCDKRCSLEVAPGTMLSLDVMPAEGSTFGGFHSYPARPPVVLVPYLGDPLARCQPPELGAHADHAHGGDAGAGQGLEVAEIADPLHCETEVVADTSILIELGLVPERLEVALAADVPALAEPAPVAKPEPPPPIEGEKLEEDKPVEVALVPPQKLPEALPPPPPPSEPPPPAKPPEPPPPDMISVEVPDQNEVEEAPDDAAHLSDKNRDVAEETRAKETNLDKASDGKVAASAESPDRDSAEVGGDIEQIRQLEEAQPTTDERLTATAHTGQAAEAKGQKSGEEGEGGQEGTGGRQDPGLLAMRDIGGRGSFAERKNGDGKKQGKSGLPGINSPLSFDDYQRIVGKDKVEEERQVAARKLSMKKGRWERKLEALRSSLENFTPDIRVGNQTALKTRAAPFAVYLARMHRSIHERWGFGFLEFLDRKSSDHPLNDFELWTDIEVALNPDGTVFKTTIAKTSGNLEFDVAALDTILSSGPYEATPEVIRSVDQRVYLRWGFYRNWRQCGTFNAHPFILTEIPGGIVPLEGAEGAAKKPVTGSAPITPNEERGVSGPKTTVRDDKAVFAANMWISAFSAASVDKLAKYSAMPFLAGTQPAALNRAELSEMYSGLLVESGALKEWKLLTAQEYLGSGGAALKLEDSDVVLVVRAASERFAIVLRRAAGGDYRATVLIR